MNNQISDFMQVSSQLIERLCQFVDQTSKFVDFPVIRFLADEKFKLTPEEVCLSSKL
jgi:hypothetical protein